jgi:hypothetical protein
LNFQINSIDASHIHEGSTKHSWVSFFTVQVSQYLKNHIQQKVLDPEDYLFSVDTRTIQNRFKTVSEQIGIVLTPHMLRSVFTEKCTISKIPDKYIDAFCGRISPGIIAKHYTDYSPEKLRLQYNMVPRISKRLNCLYYFIMCLSTRSVQLFHVQSHYCCISTVSIFVEICLIHVSTFQYCIQIQ